MSATRDLPAAATAGSAARSGRSSSTRSLKLVSAVALAFFAAFLAYAIVRATTASAPSATFPPATLPIISRNKPAPPFDLASLGGGPRVSLASLRGTPAVVNFFASWCPDCRAELDAFAQVSRRAGSSVRFVGIDSNDPNEGLARSLLAHAGATYPVGVDANGRVAVSYLVNVLPVTFFLNARGQVVGELFGVQTVASLDRALRGLTGSAAAR